MRTDSAAFASRLSSLHKRPRYVVELSFDSANTDTAYFSSHNDAEFPTGHYSFPGTIVSISGTTQSIDPLRSVSTIGEITFSVRDDGVTELFGQKLQVLKGLRGKRVRVYAGFDGLAWKDYTLCATQMIGKVRYSRGVYSVSCSDIQRGMRKDIFITAQTTLTQTIPGPGDQGYSETNQTINVADTSQFATYEHGTSYTDGTASTTCGYIKIKDEKIKYTGKTPTTFTGCSRGWLGTSPRRHEIDTSVSNARKTVVDEFVYLEMPAPKLIYALLTGKLYNQGGATLPANWHLGISDDHIDIESFTTKYPDLYKYTDDQEGFIVRFAGERRTDGKAFIEQQLLAPMAAVMLVTNSGKLSLRKMSRVLSNAGYVATFDESNVVDYSELDYSLGECVNIVAIDWNYDHISNNLTRRTALVDSVSIATHGASPPRVIQYRGVHGNRHTDSTIAQIFDAFVDRYSRPPLRMSVSTFSTLNNVEVGDIVRVRLPQVRDLTGDVYASTTLDRSFEVQRVSINWITGETTFDLLGSSGQGTVTLRTTNTTDLTDSFYSSGLASNRQINATNCGAAYSGGTLTSFAFTGHADANNTAAIWWHLGDLTIAGNCTIADNVQLRVMGTLTITGTIDGTGNGCAGAASGTVGTSAVSRTGRPGTSGLFSTQSTGGIYRELVNNRFNYYSTQGALTKGVHEGLDFIMLLNSSGTLKGLPGDLRGSGGSSGGDITLKGGTAYPDEYTIAAGGAGGDGGAGLITIARGYAFGANAQIITSGAPGSAGGVAANIGQAGSGAGGMPGGWLAILDGSSVNVPDVTKFIAQSGVPADKLPPISSPSLLNQPMQAYVNAWQMASSYYQGRAAESFADNDPIGASAFRFERVPQNITPEEDLPITYVAAPTNMSLSSGNNEVIKLTDGTVVPRIKVTFTQSVSKDLLGTRVEWRVNGGGQYLYMSPLLKPEVTETYLTDGIKSGVAYDVRIRAINIHGYDSDYVTVTNHTVLGLSDPPPDVTSLTLTNTTRGTLIISWTMSSVPSDLLGYELRYSTATSQPAWNDMTKLPAAELLEKGRLSKELTGIPIGAYWFAIKAVDTTGNYSTNARFYGSPTKFYVGFPPSSTYDIDIIDEFNSLEAYNRSTTGTGAVALATSGINGARLSATAAGAGTVEISRYLTSRVSFYSGIYVSRTAAVEFQISFEDSGSGIECYFGVGDVRELQLGDQGCIGFSIRGTTLYARNSTGSEERGIYESTLGTLQKGIQYTLSAVTSSNPARIDYYLDGVLVGTHTGNPVVFSDNLSSSSGWTFGSGFAYDATNGEIDVTTGTGAAERVLSIPGYMSYNLSFNVKNFVEGIIRAQIGAGYYRYFNITGNGTYSGHMDNSATSQTSPLQFIQSSANCNMSIDDISISTYYYVYPHYIQYTNKAIYAYCKNNATYGNVALTISRVRMRSI